MIAYVYAHYFFSFAKVSMMSPVSEKENRELHACMYTHAH